MIVYGMSDDLSAEEIGDDVGIEEGAANRRLETGVNRPGDALSLRLVKWKTGQDPSDLQPTTVSVRRK